MMFGRVGAALAFLFIGSVLSLPAAGAPSGATHARQKLIVIDPGHGGVDAGVVARNGLDEKTVTLAEARALAAVLSRRGYTVRLTRKSDEFRGLRARQAMAARMHPDLFISLHADGNGDPSVRGALVYVYSGYQNHDHRGTASGKDGADASTGVDRTSGQKVPAGSAAPAVRRKTGRLSRQFAERLIARLSAVTDMNQHGALRMARLSMLATPDVPAVLLEMGFLSNRTDAAQMRSAAWRAALSVAIADAVDDHFRDRPHKAP